jgi:aminocarboxymuconate-semialdehyde decarboxylase
MKTIDVHCHIVPADFPAMPPSCLSDKWPSMQHRENTQAMIKSGKSDFRLVDSRCWDMDRRIGDMDAEGTLMQVVSPMPELLSYWIDAPHALGLSRHINGVISDMVTKHPTRFGGLGMVPLQDPELAAKEVSTLRSNYNLSGIEIGSNILGKSPADPSFDVFYAEAEKNDLAVFVHALHPLGVNRLVGPPQSEAYICHPSDVGFAAAGCITGRLLEKFPKLRIGFSHGGGTLGAFLPRLQSGWTKLAPLTKGFASPMETARKFYYDNLAFDARLLRYLMDTFGETQIFVGSDYPFMAGQTESAKTFDALGLSQQQLNAVLYENAKRFLNLKN